MADVLYPWGYQHLLVSESRLWELARIDDLCDPATARRFKAYIKSKGGKMGIGGAVRFIQPDKPGFAEPGRSFHEMQEWFDGKKNFAALDLVMRNGTNVHRSPTWNEVPKQGVSHPDSWDYGVHANVPGEPWHLQAIEIDGWYSWTERGRPRPKIDFPLKGEVEPTPTVPDPGTIAPGTRVLVLASPQLNGIDVAYLQQTLNRQGFSLVVDGYYGQASVDAVKEIQRRNGLIQDGEVGPKTWAVIIAYNAPTPNDPNTIPIGSRYLKLASPTMRGSDVLWVQNVLKNQGLEVSADGYYGRQTRDRVKILQGWNGLTQDGEVGPKTWEVLKAY